MASNVRITRKLEAPEAVGTHYRVLCMTGKNKGICYFIKGKRIVLGRSEKADIQVLDTKSSREHAELALVGSIFVLTDLDSHNGIVVNDLKVKQHNLVNNDKIIIGQTVLKFNIIKVEANTDLEVVNENNVDEYEETVEDENKKSSGNIEDSKKKKKNLVLILGLVVVGMLFFDDDSPKKTKSATRNSKIREVDSQFSRLLKNKLKIEDKEVQVKLDAIIHRGQREYREENFFRAIEEFELALILSPNHGYASYLKNRAQQRLDESIKTTFLRANQEMGALKFQSALISYCSIIRLLKEYSEDQRYKDAESQLALVEKKLGKLEGEIKCF